MRVATLPLAEEIFLTLALEHGAGRRMIATKMISTSIAGFSWPCVRHTV